MQDYAKKTVTVDPHPHLSRPHGKQITAVCSCGNLLLSHHTLFFVIVASVHPCQHAAAMLNIIEALKECGTVPQVEQYMFIFLKFIQSVVPTIEYDYTFDVQVRGKET
jgi:ubiquitin-like-conjugating enzyme ATG3